MWSNQSSIHLDRNRESKTKFKNTKSLYKWRLELQAVQIALFHFGCAHRMPGVKKQEIKNHSGLWLRKLFAYRYRYSQEYGQLDKKHQHHLGSSGRSIPSSLDWSTHQISDGYNLWYRPTSVLHSTTYTNWSTSLKKFTLLCKSRLETKMDRVKFSFLSFSLQFSLANAVCS